MFSAGSCLLRVTLVVFLSPGIISTFLHVHPFGASIEYICSYLQRLDSKVSAPTLPVPWASLGAVFVPQLCSARAAGEELCSLPGHSVGLDSGTFRDCLFHPPPWAGASFARPGCSKQPGCWLSLTLRVVILNIELKRMFLLQMFMRNPPRNSGKPCILHQSIPSLKSPSKMYFCLFCLSLLPFFPLSL